MKFHHAFLFAALLILVSGTDARGQSQEISDDWAREEFRQFDFWIGTWDVNLRMIQPDKTWRDSVKAKVEIYPILDGKAILELWDSKPIKGFSLRYFDPAKKKWVLYLNWPSNNRSTIGSLEGAFRHGRGEFFSSHPTRDGGTMISRYSFCDITPKSLRWDDAFSKDGGKTWTHNWIMEFSRTSPAANWPAKDFAHTYQTGKRCNTREFETLNGIAGTWRGKINLEGAAEPVDAKLRVYRILDGCSIIRFLEFRVKGKTIREFSLVSYNQQAKSFEELYLDNRSGSVARVLRGRNQDGQMILSSKSKDGKSHDRSSWGLPDKATDSLTLKSLQSSDGEKWQTRFSAQFDRVKNTSAPQPKNDLKVSEAVNQVCPRSGKPIVASSLTKYRGRTVGFCNQHCRDDFANNLSERPKDREFFDKLIDALPAKSDK